MLSVRLGIFFLLCSTAFGALHFSAQKVDMGTKHFAHKVEVLDGKRLFRIQVKERAWLPIFTKGFELSKDRILILGWYSLEKTERTLVAWIVDRSKDELTLVDQVQYRTTPDRSGFLIDTEPSFRLGFLAGPADSGILVRGTSQFAAVDLSAFKAMAERNPDRFQRYNPPYYRRDPLEKELLAWIHVTPEGFITH